MKFMGMMLLLLLSSFVAVSADKEPAKPAAPVIPGSEVLLFNINQSADGQLLVQERTSATNPVMIRNPAFRMTATSFITPMLCLRAAVCKWTSCSTT